MTNTYQDIQPEDRTDARTAVQNQLRKKLRERRRQDILDVEAHVRDLIQEAKQILGGDPGDRPVEEILEEVHWYLWDDPGRNELFGPERDVDPQTLFQFRHISRLLEAGHYPDPAIWAATLDDIAIDLEFKSAATDDTRYAPVYLEPLEGYGVKTADEPSPIGRRRLAANSPMDLEEAAVPIPHHSCEHVAAVAKPRQGKDSTLVSIGMNLWRQHGYKYISIYDDDRMETPMTAIPNDEPAILRGLDRLNQEPRAFDATVYVPAIEGLPDKLPANFEQFTIGVGDLTPFLVLRLAGVNKAKPTVEDRIQVALKKTLANTSEVPELVTRLQSLALEQEATMEWTERHDNQTGDTVQSYQTTCEMPAADALEAAAQRIGKLAADGLIASDAASTNIDMKSLVDDQESAAVLCCSFLPDGREGLKYTIIDLWLRLISQVRDNYPRLPRVCVEIRELKQLAPSKWTNVRYQSRVKSLKQTIFFLVTQGGARRILLLASSQKWTDIDKSVRSNFDTRIYLNLSEDEVDTLDRIHDFSDEQKQQLLEFNPGQGMIYAGGRPYWPIEFRGAPCGLGLGDVPWLDRYGRARGCRVRGKYHNWTPVERENDWWVHVPEAQVYDVEDPPRRGDYYSEWYLLEEDFPPLTDQDDVDEDLIEAVLEQRRDHPLPSDLSLQPTDDSDKRRSLTMRAKADARKASVEQQLRQHDLPLDLKPFVATDSGQLRQDETREKMVWMLQLIDEEDVGKYKDIEEATDGEISWSAASNYLGKDHDLIPCVNKDGDTWELTELGEEALDAPWDVIAADLRGEER